MIINQVLGKVMLEASPTLLLLRGRGLNTHLCASQTSEYLGWGCMHPEKCCCTPSGLSEEARGETLGQPGMRVPGSFGCF